MFGSPLDAISRALLLIIAIICAITITFLAIFFLTADNPTTCTITTATLTQPFDGGTAFDSKITYSGHCKVARS